MGDYERAYARIAVAMVALSAAGAVTAGLLYGLPAALGFGAGAVFSSLNYRWLKQIAFALNRPAGRSKARFAVLFGLRYFLFGAAGYAIVKYFGISLLALLIGLFVAVAAVVFEILYELIYARA